MYIITFLFTTTRHSYSSIDSCDSEVAMLACIGYIVPEYVRFPGALFLWGSTVAQSPTTASFRTTRYVGSWLFSLVRRCLGIWVDLAFSPGYCSPSMNLAFTDIPNGLKGAAMVPLAGAVGLRLRNIGEGQSMLCGRKVCLYQRSIVNMFFICCSLVLFGCSFHSSFDHVYSFFCYSDSQHLVDIPPVTRGSSLCLIPYLTILTDLEDSNLTSEVPNIYKLWIWQGWLIDLPVTIQTLWNFCDKTMWTIQGNFFFLYGFNVSTFLYATVVWMVPHSASSALPGFLDLNKLEQPRRFFVCHFLVINLSMLRWIRPNV